MTQRGFGATTFEEEKQECLRWVAKQRIPQSGKPSSPGTSEELRSDREVALAAVDLDGRLLEIFSEALRDDLDVVLTAVSSPAGGGMAYQHASEATKSDLKVIIETLRYFFKLGFRLGLRREGGSWAHSDTWQDKDTALWIFRELYRDGVTELWYSELHSDIQSEIPYERFELASRSTLALKGEEGAPVLTVMTLYHRPDEQGGTGHSFHCEATLLSRTTITCQIPVQTTIEGGRARPGTTLNDLAIKLVNEIPETSQGEAAPHHIFINFWKEDGDYDEVSVWDFDRPLSDFLPLRRRA